MSTHRGLLHHLILVVADLGRSSPFYGALFRYLGYEPGDRSDRSEDWKRWDLGTPHESTIAQAAAAAAAVPHVRGAVGHHHHLAFCAAGRADSIASTPRSSSPSRARGSASSKTPPASVRSTATATTRRSSPTPTA